jgi:outer membrane protein assembly factor BamD
MKAYGFRHGVAAALLGVFLLAGCEDAFKSQEPENLEKFSPEEIFTKAEIELNKKRYDQGAQYFSEIERLYPYSEWAKRGLIMQAFVYHQGKKYDESRAAAQRYVDFFPADVDAAYAQYLLALSYYDQISDIGRDQELTLQALEAFRVVIEQYPESEYAEASKLKFDLAFSHLAAKEMEVGRYYLKSGHYGAAVNRFRVVVEDFQTTSQTPEALHRLVEAYLSLGLVDEAQSAAAILGHNYQSSEWYRASFALLKSKGYSPKVSGTGWLSKVYRQVVKGEWL